VMCPIEDRGEANGRLSSAVVLRGLLGDGCVAYVLGLLFTVYLLHTNCSWFELESHCLSLVLVAGWYALLKAGRFYCGVFGVVIESRVLRRIRGLNLRWTSRRTEVIILKEV
jgi:hypothetical protein